VEEPMSRDIEAQVALESGWASGYWR
jgi:hypothetical protein